MSDVSTVKETTKVTIAPPGKWKVIFINDDFTPMEFVIELLVTVFNHSKSAARSLALQIHENDKAVVGIYSHEVAEQKTHDGLMVSQQNGYPLQIVAESE